jgi:hypothetical protein
VERGRKCAPKGEFPLLNHKKQPQNLIFKNAMK